jgi:hypothetical protein
MKGDAQIRSTRLMEGRGNLRFCEVCGTLIREYNYLCPRCGKPVDGSIAESLSKYLLERGYRVEHNEEYLIARHTVFPHLIMAKLVSHGDDLRFEKGNPALTLQQFRLAVSNYLSSMNKNSTDRGGSKSTINPASLNQDVITAFGWHANLMDNTRREALTGAAIVWGEDHILRVLELLKNTWQHNPNLEIYVDTVNEDYEWFSNLISQVHYRKSKNMINEQIEYECRKAFSRSSLVNQSYFGKKHRFVVAY